MKAPRRALTGLIAALAVSLTVHAQDATAVEAEIAKLEARIKEETEKASRKKDSIRVEYTALLRPETKAALQARLASIAGKHRAALPKPADGAASRPAVSPSLRSAIQEDCRASVAATVGRNLAGVLDATLAENLILVIADDTPDCQEVLNTSIEETLDASDFEQAYLKVMPVFEKTLIDLKLDLAGLKQQIDALKAEERARTLGIPPGMVLVPGGKYRIGSDTKEFEAIRKELRFGETGGTIDKYALGWPAHEVPIDDFFIDVNEVSNTYWAEFVRDTGRKPPKYWVDRKRRLEKENEKARKNQGIATPEGGAAPPAGPPPQVGAEDSLIPAGMENFPVTFVTVDEVNEYLDWCGRRLPTEFEWEAAARYRSPGDKTHRWWTWGDHYDLTKAFANNQTAAANARRDPASQLTPIGAFPEGRSALGINDLLGNAAEMTASFFTPYPGWQEKSAPSQKGIEPFNPNLVVLRGGTAQAPELYTLTTTRIAMTHSAAELVGFRTALSKARGKDFIQTACGGRRLTAALEAVGPALKDEKSGRPGLAVDDVTRLSGLMAGGWNPEKNLPARAHHIAIVCRDTLEITDSTRMKSLARDKKNPLMLGYFHTAVDFVKPAVPKGSYWIMWSPGRTKVSGKDKLSMPEGFVLQSVTNSDDVYDIPNVNPPVVVSKTTEATKLSVGKSGSELNVLMSMPVRDRKEARFFVEFRLEAAPGALSAFK